MKWPSRSASDARNSAKISSSVIACPKLSNCECKQITQPKCTAMLKIVLEMLEASGKRGYRRPDNRIFALLLRGANLIPTGNVGAMPGEP